MHCSAVDAAPIDTVHSVITVQEFDMKRYIAFALCIFLASAAFAGGNKEDPDQSETGQTASQETIQDHKIVAIHYEGSLEDGTVFDASDAEPLEFMFGIGMIIPGLEEGLRGLTTGDTTEILVTAEDAYGPYYEEAVQPVPRSEFGEGIELREDMQLVGQTPQGPMVVTILEIDEEVVMVDFNHPLAGKDLLFDIEIVTVRDATQEERETFLGPEPADQ
jgi:FKBP-type peptidyl-prolyl cis-trans isomerase 2